MAILKYEQAKTQHPGENTERRFLHLDNLMTAIIDFSNGPMNEPDPPHHHPHEQITYVAKGELYFFIDKERYHLEEGDAISVPSDIPHTIQTISKEVRLIDSFSPVREDFITS